MKNILSLNGHWQLAGLDNGREIEASVPGDVHTDLYRAKVIADPYFR